MSRSWVQYPPGRGRESHAARDTRRARTQEDRWAVPSLQARPGGPAERFAGTASATATRPRCSSRRCSSGFAVLVGRVARRRVVVDRRAPRHVGGLGARRRGAIASSRRASAAAFLDRRLDGRLDGRRRARAADPRRPVAIVCAFRAAGGSPRSPSSCSSIESATYRVTSLVVPRHRPTSPRLEDLPGERELPVRPHRRVDRRLRRPRAAAHSGVRNRGRARSPPGWWRSCSPSSSRSSRMYRGMHHPLDVAGGRAHRHRRDDGAAVRVPRRGRRRALAAPASAAPARADASVAPHGRPRHEGRGRRPRREDARRRPAGAAPRARRPRAPTTRSGTRCPRPRRRPRRSRRALDEGAELVFAWGGDGTVRRCIGELAGPGRVPRGHPRRHREPLRDEPGHPDGHRAGGRDRAARRARGASTSGASPASASPSWPASASTPQMIRDADDLKDRIGRVAYLFSGSRHLRQKPFEAADRGRRRRVVRRARDLHPRSATSASSSAASRCSPTRGPDDGMLELGVCTADGLVQWARTLARTAGGDPSRSPFVRATKAREVKVELDRKVLYELDGGDRKKVKSFKVKVEPGALQLCVPRPDRDPEERMTMARIRTRLPDGRARPRGRAAGEDVARTQAARVAGPRRPRRPRRDLRAHRRPGPQGRVRRRRQDHQPAGRAEDDRRAAVRQGPARPRRDRARSATRLWRLVRAAIGHGPETGEDDAKDRISGLVSGIAYAALCVTAVKILFGSSGSSSSSKTGEGDRRRARLARSAGTSSIVAGLVVIGVARRPGAQGHQEEVPRGLEDRADEPERRPGVHRGRRRRPPRARGRLRPDRLVRHQGRDRLRPRQGGRPRPGAGEARPSAFGPVAARRSWRRA